MRNLNFSDLYRFLVSLGIIFYVLAFTIPWLLYKDTTGYLIQSENFETLTEESKQIISQAQSSFNYWTSKIPKLPAIENFHHLFPLLFIVNTYSINPDWKLHSTNRTSILIEEKIKNIEIAKQFYIENLTFKYIEKNM